MEEVEAGAEEEDATHGVEAEAEEVVSMLAQKSKATHKKEAKVAKEKHLKAAAKKVARMLLLVIHLPWSQRPTAEEVVDADEGSFEEVAVVIANKS